MQRLVIDHDSHPQQLRKPVSFKDAVKVHQACGAYLFFLAKIQQIAPENQFEAIRTDLFIQFKAGLLDPDLLHIVESQVPANADIKAVSAFRLAVAKSTGDMTYLLYFLQHSFDAQFESWTSIFSHLQNNFVPGTFVLLCIFYQREKRNPKSLLASQDTN